ncbi:MAG: CotS family spore coat protein [Bacillota bacterium]
MQIESVGREFGCRVHSIKPLRAVYIADTDRGAMIIKEASRDPDKLLYIHGLKEYLFDRGFKNLDRYLPSNSGLPFVIYEDRIFVMEEFIPGRECCFTNPFDRESAVKALAELHKAGKGYVPATGAAKRDNIGKWTKSSLKKIDYMLEIKSKTASKRRKDFYDRVFLRDVDFMLQMSWRSYDTLRSSGYENACIQAKAENTICHHDYTYHNIIIDKEGAVNVIDFDYSCHELPIYDLASFIMKVLKRFYFDIDIALNIIEDYDSIVTVSRNDLLMMLSLFEFPQRFWRLTERYYEKKTDWSDSRFRHKYEDVELLKEYIIEFTEKFRKHI